MNTVNPAIWATKNIKDSQVMLHIESIGNLLFFLETSVYRLL